MTSPTIQHQNGQCLCGAVKFTIQNAKILFNELCHCRACSRARGMSPVHLVGVPEASFVVDPASKAFLTTVPGSGSSAMRHTNCKSCGVGIYQQPEGKSFVATFPTTYQIETTSGEEGSTPSSLLPEYLLPRLHANYENRHFDWHDALPKYQAFPGSGPQMTNEGQPIRS